MRAYLIRALKRTIRRVGSTSTGGKLLRLVAEEYTVNECARATRAAEQILRATLAPLVLRGPFAGLRYPTHAAVGSTYWPKILGSYESELAPTFEVLLKHDYVHIVDIGAAEGYYAVGLARRLPSAQVIAFEGNPVGRQLLEAMAALNHTRVRVEGWCDTNALLALTPLLGMGRALILCDAESAEYDLLDPIVVPMLSSCDLIVELHRRKNITDPRAWMAERFGGTHTLSFVESEPRVPSAYPELQALPPDQRGAVLFERTDPFGWAVLVRRERTPSTNQ